MNRAHRAEFVHRVGCLRHADDLRVSLQLYRNGDCGRAGKRDLVVGLLFLVTDGSRDFAADETHAAVVAGVFAGVAEIVFAEIGFLFGDPERAFVLQIFDHGF